MKGRGVRKCKLFVSSVLLEILGIRMKVRNWGMCGFSSLRSVEIFPDTGDGCHYFFINLQERAYFLFRLMVELLKR